MFAFDRNVQKKTIFPHFRAVSRSLFLFSVSGFVIVLLVVPSGGYVEDDGRIEVMTVVAVVARRRIDEGRLPVRRRAVALVNVSCNHCPAMARQKMCECPYWPQRNDA